ncbi:MAG: response regulator [Deltaproteobacteria bacterium]|nr:response regulator [Deltaproteobacteria bacterium]
MGIRILLVDGCTAYRKVVAGALVELGYSVAEASDAASGLAAVHAEPPRLALVDDRLPDARGLEFIDRVRALGVHTQFCLVIGPEEEAASCNEDHFDLRILRGPVHPSKLVREIHSLAGASDTGTPALAARPAPSHVSYLSEPPPPPARPGRSSDSPLEDVRRSYAAKLPAEIAILGKAVARARDLGDPASVTEAHRLAHAIHGTAGTLGFGEISEGAREIENLLHPGRFGDGLDHEKWARIERALARIESAPRQPRTRTSVAPPAPNVGTVLVADRDPAALVAFKAMGHRGSIKVLTARSEAEALARAHDTRLDGAIIDTDIGGADVFEICRSLRSLPGHSSLPLAVMSTDSSVSNRVAAAYAGASVFLQKPISDAELAETVRHFIASTTTEKTRILLLDDDEDFSAFLAGMLTQERMEVTTVPDPSRILDVLAETRPDILLLDVVMPFVSGLDVCRMLRSTSAHRELPILFLTAETSVESRVACFEAGGDDYIEKPVVREELLARIEVRMDRQRLFRQRADRDALTGLFSRRAFVESLNARLSDAGRRERPVAVCLIDIDHFKSINDSFGHLAGDRVLAALGRLFSSRFRANDVRGRWGGEEFVMALDGEEPDTARMILNQVLAEFRRMVFEGDHGESFTVSFSGGVASFPRDGKSIDGLLRVADTHLYEAKNLGRSRIEG